MYAAMGTQPNIVFAVSTVAQFSNNPGWAHWEAVKQIFRYLWGTQKLESVYGGEKRGLEGYIDADGASQEHRHAISGFVFLVDGRAILWSSKKQELVTLSTTEAKYVAATHAEKEAVWIWWLIGEIFRPCYEQPSLYSFPSIPPLCYPILDPCTSTLSPSSPTSSDLLYDSFYESFLFLAYDSFGLIAWVTLIFRYDSLWLSLQVILIFRPSDF